jgi:3-oxoadipate enol-lactonase
MEPFREDLAVDHRILTCEPPGSGDSSAPHGVPSTRALARDVIRVLQFLEAPRAHLFGISLGGMVAQWVALDAPERVDRLVLASTTARRMTPAEALTARNVGFARAMLEAEPALRMAEHVVSDEVLRDPEEHERIARAVRAHPHGRRELLWLAAAGARHDTRARLGELQCRTLILTGREDRLFPPAVQGELAALIPGAQQRFIDGAGHDVTIDRPAETAARVRAFLRAP